MQAVGKYGREILTSMVVQPRDLCVQGLFDMGKSLVHFILQIEQKEMM